MAGRLAAEQRADRGMRVRCTAPGALDRTAALVGGSLLIVRGARSWLDVAESAWGWVMGQVRWDDDGPWVPTSVPAPVG